MSETDWSQLLTPEPRLAEVTAEELTRRLHNYAEWIEGGDPSYIEDLYSIAFEQGRRMENPSR